MAASQITAIIAVSLIIATDGQYQLSPGEQQRYAFSPIQIPYNQPNQQYGAYQSQLSGGGEYVSKEEVKSSTLFDFGPRRVAVQVDHQAGKAYYNDFGDEYGSAGNPMDSTPERRILNKSPQSYRLPIDPSQSSYDLPSYNSNTGDQSAYTITNPINGEKYSLYQPGWDSSAYNLNVQYSTESNSNKQVASPYQSEHNFQYNSGFLSQPNYFESQNPPSQAGYFLSHDRYNRRIIPSFYLSANRHRGEDNPEFIKSYEVNDPSQPKIAHRLIYTKAVETNKDKNDKSSKLDNIAVQELEEIPKFESGKVTTTEPSYDQTINQKKKYESESHESPFTTPSLLDQHASIGPLTVLRTFKENFLKFLPPKPTVIHPDTSENQNNLKENWTARDDSSLENKSQTQTTPSQEDEVARSFHLLFKVEKLYVTDAPKDGSISVTNKPFSYETTPPTRNHTFKYYPSTPPDSSYRTNDLNPPLFKNVEFSTSYYEPTTEKQETLLSINGFTEPVTSYPEFRTEIQDTSFFRTSTTKNKEMFQMSTLEGTLDNQEGKEIINLFQNKTVIENQFKINSFEVTENPRNILLINPFKNKTKLPPESSIFIYPTNIPEGGSTETLGKVIIINPFQNKPQSTTDKFKDTLRANLTKIGTTENIGKLIVINPFQNNLQIPTNDDGSSPLIKSAIDQGHLLGFSDKDLNKRIKEVKIFKKPIFTPRPLSLLQGERITDISNIFNDLPTEDAPLITHHRSYVKPIEHAKEVPLTTPTSGSDSTFSRLGSKLSFQFMSNDEISPTTRSQIMDNETPPTMPRSTNNLFNSNIQPESPIYLKRPNTKSRQRNQMDLTVDKALLPNYINLKKPVLSGTTPLIPVNTSTENKPTVKSRLNLFVPIAKPSLTKDIEQTVQGLSRDTSQQDSTEFYENIQENKNNPDELSVFLIKDLPHKYLALQSTMPSLSEEMTQLNDYQTTSTYTSSFNDLASTEEPNIFVTTLKDSEMIRSQRGRVKFSTQQRSLYRSSYRENSNNLARSGRYSLNRRIKTNDPINSYSTDEVNNPRSSNSNSNDDVVRRKVRYHAVNRSPHRHVIRRVKKIRTNRKGESFVRDDSDISRNVQNRFIRNRIQAVSTEKTIEKSKETVPHRYKHFSFFGTKPPKNNSDLAHSSSSFTRDHSTVAMHTTTELISRNSDKATNFEIATTVRATDTNQIDEQSSQEQMQSSQEDQTASSEELDDNTYILRKQHVNLTEQEFVDKSTSLPEQEQLDNTTPLPEQEYFDISTPFPEQESLETSTPYPEQEYLDYTTSLPEQEPLDNSTPVYEPDTMTPDILVDNSNLEQFNPSSDLEGIYSMANPVQIIVPSMNPQAVPVTKIDIVTSISEE